MVNDVPTYVTDDGRLRTPIEYRRIRDYDERVAAWVRHEFQSARRRGTHR